MRQQSVIQRGWLLNFMGYEQKQPDNGTIFLQRNSSKNPKAPQFKGSGKDDQGRDIEVAYWEGVSAGGKEWKRLKIGPPYRQGDRQPSSQESYQPDRSTRDVPLPSAPKPGTTADPEDDVPFAFPSREFNWRKME